MSLVLLTKPPKLNFYSVEKTKVFVNDILGRLRGPKAVTASMLRGLGELGVDFKFNPLEREIKENDVILVNESVNALKWAIQAKAQMKIGKLLAGPNISILPSDNAGIICAKEIDIVLEPSQWVKDFLIYFKPELENKICVWPAGVMVPSNENEKIRNFVLLYNKNPSEKDLLDFIKKYLHNNKINFNLINYGSFNQAKYFDWLSQSKMMIYLSNSESQGLSLQEAWVRDVPTLIWNRGYMEYNGNIWKDEKISAPYQTEKTGDFFNGKEDFVSAFMILERNLEKFSPKDYVINNLTDKICASKLLDIVNNI